MTKWIALFLIAVPMVAQTTSGRVTMGGKITHGVYASTASGVVGLVDYNQSFAQTTGVLSAMQFVYSQFEQKSPVPHGTADECTINYNNKVYVIAGYGTSDTDYLNYVQIYDPVTDTWTQGATKTTAEWGAGCALYNGKIYTFAGVTSPGGWGTKITTAEVYDIAGNSWSTLTSLPTACGDGTLAVTVGSFIYVLWNSNFWKFDPAGAGGAGSYTAMTTPPSGAQVQWAATGYVNISGDDRIYFLAGSIPVPAPPSAPSYSNSTYYYSVTNNTWSSALANAPFAAHGMAQNSVYNGLIYFAGGFDGTYFHDAVYSYNPATNAWSGVLANMNSFRDGIGGGFVANKLFLIGGRNATSSPFGVTANESYDVGAPSITTPFTKLQLNYNTVSPSGNVRMGIYSDSGGVPGSLLLDAGQVAIANGWVTISGLNVNPTIGTRYWLVFIQDTAKNVSYTGGRIQAPGGSGSHCYGTATFGALPSTFPASPTCSDNSMYAEKLTVN